MTHLTREHILKLNFKSLLVGEYPPQIGTSKIRQLHHFHQDNDGSNKHHSWSVLKHLQQKQLKQANRKIACLLLNISDQSHDKFKQFKYIWDQADFRLAVDGSANYLDKRQLLHTAHVISGDFDSINPKLIERIRSNKALKHNRDNSTSPIMPQIIETPCQKETDFTKAIRIVESLKPDTQIIFGLYHADGTRLDHLFGLVNTLHLIRKVVFIINTQSSTLSWLLRPGAHRISKLRGSESCCLASFVGNAEVKTNGLQYDLHPDKPLSFGQLVSSSNFCNENKDRISIETNKEILWSVNLAEG